MLWKCTGCDVVVDYENILENFENWKPAVGTGATNSSKPYVHNDCPGSAGLDNASLDHKNNILCRVRSACGQKGS